MVPNEIQLFIRWKDVFMRWWQGHARADGLQYMLFISWWSDMGELSGDQNTSLFSPGIDVSIRHKEGPAAIVTRENGQITFYTIHERNRRCDASERKHNPSCVWVNRSKIFVSTLYLINIIPKHRHRYQLNRRLDQDFSYTRKLIVCHSSSYFMGRVVICNVYSWTCLIPCYEAHN